jgi:hypothetical protein
VARTQGGIICDVKDSLYYNYSCVKKLAKTVGAMEKNNYCRHCKETKLDGEFKDKKHGVY